MSLMRAETLRAPDAVGRCLAQDAAFDAVTARLRRLDPALLVIGARGSSAHAGTLLRYVLARRLGLLCATAMPSLASVYGTRQRMRGALFLAISQSGASPDLVRQVEMARGDGAFSLALVNDAGSLLASACDAVIDIAAGPERSVAATGTVLATMAAGLALAASWTGIRDPVLAPCRSASRAPRRWGGATGC